MNNVPIFNIKVASQLVKRGFQVVELAPNKFDREKTVVFFNKSEHLIQVLSDDYQITLRRNNNNDEHIIQRVCNNER